jgi:hypothetical protein
LRCAVFGEGDGEARIVAAAAVVIIVLRERAWTADIEVSIERVRGERQRVLLTLAAVELKHVSDGVLLIGFRLGGFECAADGLTGLQPAAHAKLAARRQSGRHNERCGCPNVHNTSPEKAGGA